MTAITDKGSIQPPDRPGDKRFSVPVGTVLLAACVLLLAPATAQAQLTFGSPHAIETNSNKWWAKALGDINGDGLLDLVVQDDNGNGGWLGWYETLPGATAWTQHIIANSPPGGGTFAGGDMEIADLDNDGDIDVLGFDHPGEWDNSGASTDIYWYENNGDGSVWTAHLIGQSPDFVKDVSIADFNLDGRPDIATVCFDTHTLTVFRQDSPTSWSKAKEFTVTNLHEGMDAGDIDGDGDPDLAPNGYWIENPGGDLTGTWTTRPVDTRWHSDPAGTNFRHNATKVFCQDITGDGRDEVFISDSENAEPISWYGTADPVNGPWTEHVIANGYTYTHTLHVYDMDLDGDFDVVAGENGDQSSDGRLTVFVNGGDNLTWTEEVLTTDGSYNSLVGDVEGDGDMDVWRHPGHEDPLFELIPNETPPPILPLGDWERHLIDGSLPDKAIYVLAGDLDGDGYQDLAAGPYWWRSSGTFDGEWTRNTIGSPLNNVAIMADFDRDGDLDLFGTQGTGSASNHDFAWARNDGTGTFTVLTNINTGGSGDFLQGVVLSDFGLGDQIALSWHNGGGGVQAVTIPSDPSSETWSFSTLSPTTLKEDLSAGDIDDDGDTDLLLGTVWLRNDGGSWSAHTLGDISDLDGDAEPDRNDLADMDDDGDLDAVIGLENGKYLLWFEAPATPASTWTRHVIESNVAGEGFSMDVADFDRDDDPDVVLGEHRGSAVNRVLIFENSSDGTSWATHEVDSDATGVIDHHDGTQAVDLDYDGDLDLISLGWTNEKIWIFENRALTGGGSPPDNQAPSVPGNLHTTSVEAREIDLSWNASTDNVGVTGYRIYRDGEYLRTVPSTTHDDSGLQPSTTYSYEVSAIDAAGNESGKSSPPVEATTLEAPPISETLIAAYSFDEGSGPTAFDFTHNNHDGTLENDPAWTTEGQYDGAIEFDGTNDYIDIGTFDLDAAGVTISAWVRRGSCPTGDCRIVSKATGHYDPDHYFMLSLISGNQLRFRLKAGGSTTTMAGGNIPDNTWTHVAATYDGTTMELYIDGDPVTSTPKTGTIDSSPATPVWIGANPSDAYAPWGGILDNLKIYGSALSQSEIQTDMNTAVGDLGLNLDVKLLLEGAYASSGAMSADLASAGIIPLDQPYGGPAWNHTGTESVASGFFASHTNIVDWVLVRLRSGTPDGTMTIEGTRAGFLTSDGSVVDTDGLSDLSFTTVSSSALYVEVIHRNHLAVMTASTVDFSSGTGTVDFTATSGEYYGGAGAAAALGVGGTGPFGLISGDADSDGNVFPSDLIDFWIPQSGGSGYLEADFDLDGNVFPGDLVNHWISNSGKSTSVPIP